MPPCRSNRFCGENEADPAFTAADVEIMGFRKKMGCANPIDINVWLERFRKRENLQLSVQQSTSVRQKKCDSTYREVLQRFGMRRSVQGQILNTKFTDVAQVANASYWMESTKSPMFKEQADAIQLFYIMIEGDLRFLQVAAKAHSSLVGELYTHMQNRIVFFAEEDEAWKLFNSIV
ncbi:hypothetical protein Tco_0993164 [Tanacetum coccineum]|uniref:Uncharacterized protein n=1 Tax=Tanacetum coccineum TaxID=301880 RepID=A0ABQ5F5G0_9ASTR